VILKNTLNWAEKKMMTIFSIPNLFLLILQRFVIHFCLFLPAPFSTRLSFQKKTLKTFSKLIKTKQKNIYTCQSIICAKTRSDIWFPYLLCRNLVCSLLSNAYNDKNIVRKIYELFWFVWQLDFLLHYLQILLRDTSLT